MVVTLDLSAPIAVFPLPGCVMLPHTLMPLQIFEPRYKKMTMDCLDSAGLIAMGLFQKDVSQEDYLHGRPELRKQVCVGQVQEYQKTEDARFVLLLGGVCRATVEEEVPHEPYRKIRVKPVKDEPLNPTATGQFRRRLSSLLGDTAMNKFEPIEKLRDLLKEKEPMHVLIDVMFAAAVEHAEERYAFLSEPSTEARAAHLLRALEAVRAGLDAG